MTDLRKLARGQQCMVRIPGVCNHDPATTVLAHFRLAGLCGTGQKPIDECGAWACSSCHDFVDGRLKSDVFDLSAAARFYHAEGVMRTLDALHKMGYRVRKEKPASSGESEARPTITTTKGK